MLRAALVLWEMLCVLGEVLWEVLWEARSQSHSAKLVQ